MALISTDILSRKSNNIYARNIHCLHIHRYNTYKNTYLIKGTISFTQTNYFPPPYVVCPSVRQNANTDSITDKMLRALFMQIFLKSRCSCSTQSNSVLINENSQWELEDWLKRVILRGWTDLVWRDKFRIKWWDLLCPLVWGTLALISWTKQWVGWEHAMHDYRNCGEYVHCSNGVDV